MSAFVCSGLRRVILVVLTLALAAPAMAAAATPTTGGGASYSEPEIRRLKCAAADRTGCPRGAQLRVKGEGLASATSIVFRGRRGAADDRTAAPIEKGPHAVVVRVPASAKSGRIRAVTAASKADGPHLKLSKTKVVSTSVDGPGIFPIRGKHTYGDGIGAGRGHQGAGRLRQLRHAARLRRSTAR